MFTNADNYAPWGAHQGASLLHDEIRNNNNGHFKAVTFDEAWQYTNSGYAVYLTAYNSAYYVNSNNSRVPGHIATCYTENKENEDANKVPDPKVIQAGSTTGTITVKKVWGSSMITNNNVKANLYLGYIIK
jgi:hypothetical protein